jgi:hypothetical protein
MREVTDTSGSLSPGKYKFTVIEEPKKVHMGKATGFEFTFSAVNDNGARCEYKERFPVWLMGDLLKALGQKEVSPGKYDWDTTDVADLAVSAEIVYEDFVKDGITKSYPKMKKITTEVPF